MNNCEGRNMSKRKTTEEFIHDAIKIHGDKYDYSLVDYKDNHTQVKIVCPTHGVFEQTPRDHLSKKGCKYCAGKGKTTESFIKEANIIHNGKYSYDKTLYVKSDSPVIITCPIHGDYEKTPNKHLAGQGCKYCSREEQYKKQHSNKHEFIQKAIIVHKDRYSYDNVVYKKAILPVSITCRIHGDFNQTPHDHLCGCGCPSCKASSLENEIRELLKTNNIAFKEQYKTKWLGLQSLDFYLPKYKVAIECQGIQHFQIVEFFGGEKHFEYMVELDGKKRQRCKENGINILYYSNLNIKYPYKVFEDKNKLLEEITKQDDIRLGRNKQEFCFSVCR